MGTSRYDRARPVGSLELDEARALHAIGHLVIKDPGITNSVVAGKVGQVLHTGANELGNGRALPIEVRRTGRALANAIREDMQPAEDLGSTP